jgi:hypothetical protein
MWETRSRSHARNAEALMLDSLIALAADLPVTFDIRVVELGNGYYTNPTRIIACRTGERAL